MLRLGSMLWNGLCGRRIRNSHRQANGPTQSRGGGRLSRRNIIVELLEERRLLAVWDGGPDATGTNWHDPVNWVGDALPLAGEDVEIGPAFAAIPIFSNQNASVGSLDSDAALYVSGGLFSIDASSSISAALVLGGGTLTGAGDVTIAAGGSMTWLSGTMSGTGRTIVAAGGTLTISSDASKVLGRTIDNAGAASYTGSELYFGVAFGVGGIINNLAGGTFTVEGDGDFTWNFGGFSQTFNNQGTFVRRGAGTTNFAAVVFNTSGSIDVQEGTLVAAGANGSVSGGTFSVAAGATLDLTGNYLQGAITGSGAGTVLIAGSVNIDGGGATVNFAPGLLQWTAGTLAGGTLTNTGSLTIAGAAEKYVTTTIQSSGEIHYTGSGLFMGGGFAVPGTINNLAGATFIADGDGDFSGNGGGTSHTFNNQGTFVRRGAGTTNFSGVVFNTSGSIDVQEGTLSAAGVNGGVSGGTFTVAAGATLDLTGNALQGSIAGSGAGTVLIAGNVNIDGGGATVDFSPGLLQWAGGTLAGGPLANTGSLTIAGAATKVVGATIDNSGEIHYTGSELYFGTTFGVSAVINNLPGATFTVDGDGDFSWNTGGAAHRFDNQGTFVRRGVGTTIFSAVSFNNSEGTVSVEDGVIEAQSGGAVSGTVTIEAGVLRLAGGTLALAAGANIVGSGVLEIAAGTMSVDGAAAVTRLNLAGGQLIGDADLTINPGGVWDWSGGTMSGTGRTIVAVGAAATISGTASKVLGRTIENAGVMSYTGSELYFGPAFGVAGVINNLAGATFTADGDGDFSWGAGGATLDFNNQGTFVRRGAGTTVFSAIAFNNSGGTVRVEDGDLSAPTGAASQFDSQRYLSLLPGASVTLPGGLTGSTTNVDQFAPLGTVTLSGGPAGPHLIEAMGRDVGHSAAGFRRNFAYGTLRLASGQFHLVDSWDNALGAGAEALYVDTLVLPAGSVLDLNGLHVYARVAELGGTVVGGTVEILPDSGPIVLNLPTSGTITLAGETDEWTFFGRAGRAITLFANPGDGASPRPANPNLAQVAVDLLDPAGNVIATGSSSTVGEIVAAGVELPSDGTYRVRVHAVATLPDSVGNYLLSVYDATVDNYPLIFNQPSVGALETGYGIGNRSRMDRTGLLGFGPDGVTWRSHGRDQFQLVPRL